METGDDRRRMVLAGAIAGCLLATLCCILAAVLGFGGLAYMGMQGPQDVDIEVIAPTLVDVGETFTVEVRITNRASELKTLNAINISTDYLDGIEIQRSTPTWVLNDRLNIFGVGFEVYTFQENIFGGETLVIEFTANAVSAGDFAGDFDVCINNLSQCKMVVTRTVVR